MLRLLLKALVILHLGPGLAFLVLAFGCDGVEPALGAACAGGTLKVFVQLTLALWLLLSLGTWAASRRASGRSASAEGG